jgi:hypothetical protein
MLVASDLTSPVVAGLAVMDFKIFVGDDRGFSDSGSDDKTFSVQNNKVRCRSRIRFILIKLYITIDSRHWDLKGFQDFKFQDFKT